MPLRKFIITILVIVAILASLSLITPPNPTTCGPYEHATLTVGTTTIDALVANDKCKQVLGLSGREALAPNTGILFIFPTEDFHGFWMKDMLFPLDMIWLDNTHTVVALEQNVSPTTYPTPFGTNVLSRFVLELPAGYAAQHSIEVGKAIEF